MDPYSIPFVATALDAVHWLVTSFAALLAPVVGPPAAALALVAITVLVRVALIPVGVSTVRAELTRRRLAPALRELQRRYARNPQLLQRKTMELYASQKASPFAGCLPLLAQAPVLSLLYGVFVARTVNGHPNALLDRDLLGVGLGDSLVWLLGSGAWWPALAVFGCLLAVIAVVALLTRATTLRLTPDAPGMRWMSWLPLMTVGFAAFVPLAATLYLAVSTSWTFAERAVLRRLLA